MTETMITAPLKQVGNSLCVFIPAEVRDELNLRPKEEIVLHIHKRKNKKEILSLSGITKGKLGPWNEEEDRLNERE